MISHQLSARYPAFAEEFWDAVEQVRESGEFQEKIIGFYEQL
jgi:hypothetical protein